MCCDVRAASPCSFRRPCPLPLDADFVSHVESTQWLLFLIVLMYEAEGTFDDVAERWPAVLLVQGSRSRAPAGTRLRCPAMAEAFPSLGGPRHDSHHA